MEWLREVGIHPLDSLVDMFRGVAPFRWYKVIINWYLLFLRDASASTLPTFCTLISLKQINHKALWYLCPINNLYFKKWHILGQGTKNPWFCLRVFLYVFNCHVSRIGDLEWEIPRPCIISKWMCHFISVGCHLNFLKNLFWSICNSKPLSSMLLSVKWTST